MVEKEQVTISIPTKLKQRVDDFQSDMNLNNRSHTMRIILTAFFDTGYNLAGLDKDIEGAKSDMDELKEEIKQIEEIVSDMDRDAVQMLQQTVEEEKEIEQEDEEQLFEPGSDEERIADMVENMDMSLEELENDFPEFQEGGQNREAFKNVKEKLDEA